MSFENWLQLIGQIQDGAGDTAQIVCPGCSRTHAIDFQYVGSPETRIGYLAIWCKHCNLGIHMSRSKVPNGFDFIPFGSPSEVIRDRIPNFERVEPVSLSE